jgi:hypothetical protein
MKTLKHFRLSLLAFLSITLIAVTSCEKEDENLITASIVGEWTTQSTNVDITVNGISLLNYLIDMGLPADQAQAMVTLFSADMDFPTSIEFKEDGTYTVTMSDSPSESGTWSQSEDKKTLTMDAGTEDEMELTIKVLNDTTLEVEAIETETSDMDEDGTDDTMEIKMNLKFSR